MPRPLRVAIAGGGTGGHIEPALNLADELRRRDPETHLVVFGTQRGLEVDLVPARGYALSFIPPVPLPRRVNRDLISLPNRLRTAVAAARRIMVEQQVDVLAGFGGYVSIPTYLAARRAGVPFVVHEANARPGLANRVGARLTPYVAENYAGSLPHAQRHGCPLRPAIAELDRAASREQGRQFFGLKSDGPVLLVFGGSQGAASINRAIWDVAQSLSGAGVQVLHAVGVRQRDEGVQFAARHIPGYVAVPFIDRMDLAYAAADAAVCRAGAMTCAEVAAVGLPAIYVPYAVGNGEQRLNAAPVVDAGGGRVIPDAEITGGRLRDAVLPLLQDPSALAAMSAAAAGYGIRDGAARLADMVADAGAVR
jgi:UDP-N-acetylglucosamine--N-acetylmuramyl-(pentapeptide) pyrophosphoryl-undecaprenol N-acetylglucosamine transferase